MTPYQQLEEVTIEALDNFVEDMELGEADAAELQSLATKLLSAASYHEEE